MIIQQGRQGAPLYLVEQQHYDSFVSVLTDTQQNRLNALKLTSNSTGWLIDDQGNTELAIALVDDIDAPFVGGDFSSALPAGNYYLASKLSQQQQINIAISWGLGAYEFNAYKSKTSEPKACLYVKDEPVITQSQAVIDSINLTRTLINTPANDMMPQHLGEAADSLAKKFDSNCKQIIGDDLLTQNYPLIHAVGRASEHAPRLIDLRWGKSEHPKLTLVGKGICFDSGGLDLKPANAMRYMKKDMGGAAQVLGLASLIMHANLPVRLRVLIPAAENAVSSNAFRPGDVIKSRAGLTVEIDNTDAEGRLVLADAISEAITEQPDLLVDFATLTGACRIAVGTEIAGYFCNQNELACELQALNSGVDPVWQLPLHQDYAYMLESQVADVVNSASEPYAGASTAALFLQKFVGDTPWLHFDVMAWNLRARAGRPKGGEAMGIRTLFTYLKQRYSHSQ